MTYLLKVNLLLLRVSVVKPHYEFPFEEVLVVLIQQRSLGMTNVEVANWKETKYKTYMIVKIASADHHGGIR